MKYLVPTAAIIAVMTADANACSISSAPAEESARKIAENGVVIDGTLIQAFDAGNRRSQIIEAEKIYVGGDQPRKFVIYHSDAVFQRELDPNRTRTSCDNLPGGKIGQRFKRLILFPAISPADSEANGKWIISYSDGNVRFKNSLALLEMEAAKAGRLLAPLTPLTETGEITRPPASP